MANCPFCNAALTEHDIQWGSCHRCSQSLPHAELDELHDASEEPAELWATPSPRPRQAQPAAMAGDRGEDTPVPPRPEKTLDDGAQSSVPPPVEGKGTSDDQRITPTIELRGEPQDVVRRVTMLWQDRVPTGTSAKTTIEGERTTLEARANLVIQPRNVQEIDATVLDRPDYELLEQIGKGGMGVVLSARQASIDRTVALKMLSPEKAQDIDARRRFLSEAVVTGDLEHPNIVPIYDVGSDRSGALFYSMKRVKGTPWDTVILQKTLPENMEFLMRVADAVAFAHSRNVIHRDLKPENVMLGDYGQVLLMDWGLAISVEADAVTAEVAGSPAYMAPEMAAGPVERIGIASDVYLLGAILYEIITGNPPHAGKTVIDCLLAAGKNTILATEKSGELLDVARRAMATELEDRYRSVGEFQEAIRTYQSHSESIALSTHAQKDLEEAKETHDYTTFAQALFAFRQAFALWDGNSRAQEGVVEASLAYAQSALHKGDYDLGASLLDGDNPRHADSLHQIQEALRERNARRRRLKTAKRLAGALVVVVLSLSTVAFFWIRGERDYAHGQREIAVAAEGQAKEDRDKAERSAEEAREEKKIADAAKDEARDAENTARDAEKAALAAETTAREKEAEAKQARREQEYEAYIARIGLAAAKIEENAFVSANALLEECRLSEYCDWEWGRLRHLCQQQEGTFDAERPIEAIAFSPDGKRFAAGGWGGVVRVRDVDLDRVGGGGFDLAGARVRDIDLNKPGEPDATGGLRVFSVAFSHDGNQIAVGTNDWPNYVKIFQVETGALLHSLSGHDDAVVSLAYSADGTKLLTGSYDNTARLWDLKTGKPWVRSDGLPAVFPHESWVWSAAFSPDEKRIVTASQDGSAKVWGVEPLEVKETVEAETTFSGHDGPVYTAAFSPDGQFVATGGYDKRILLWEPRKIQPFDLGALALGQRILPPEYQTLDGHAAGVRSLHFSDHGERLLSSGNDNTIRVWDVAARKLIKTMRGHGGRVPACVFDPGSDDRVLSGSHDHSVKIWDIAAYEESRVLGSRVVLPGHSDAVLGADFSPDSRQVVSASRDRTARLWSVESGKELHQFKEGHDFLVSNALFYPDGKSVLTAAVDNTVRIWDVDTGGQRRTLKGTGFSAAMALSNDAKWILTGGDADRNPDEPSTNLWSAKLWDAQTGDLLKKLPPSRWEITAVAISPDNAWLFTADAKGHCCLWNAETFQQIWEADKHTRKITAARFLPGGDRILTASADNTVAQWDLQTGQEDSRILPHPEAVTSISLASDNHHLLTTCEDGVARLWNIATGSQVGQIPASHGSIHAASFSRVGGRAVSAHADGTMRVWDVEDIGHPKAAASFTAGSEQTWSMAFSPDGQSVLTTDGDEARLWNLSDGSQSMRFARQDSLASARFSTDGKWIVTGSWDNTAKIWNVKEQVVELILKDGHTANVNDAVFSGDNTKVLTAGDDNTAVLWKVEKLGKVGEVATGEVLFRFQGHTAGVNSVAISPNGERVITGSQDHTAKVWDAATSKEILTLQGHTAGVNSVAFSPDGKTVITGGADNLALLWDADTGARILTDLEHPVTFAGHTAGVNSVAFSPNGRRVITGSQDQTAKVWDSATGKEILTLKGHAQEVTTVGFSPDPDGRIALTGSRDGALILWLTADWHNQPEELRNVDARIGPQDESLLSESRPILVRHSEIRRSRASSQ